MQRSENPTKGRRLLLLGVGMLKASLLISPLGATEVFHVAEAGDDNWSGRFAKPLEDGSDGPLATFSGAREKVRERIADHDRSREEIIVTFRGGRYAIEESAVFTEADSGMASAPVTWKAYPGETVLLDGGIRVSGFQSLESVAGQMPETRIPEPFHKQIQVVSLQGKGIDYTRGIERRSRYTLDGAGPLQLYHNEEAMPLARYPDKGWVRVADVPQEAGPPIREGHHSDRRDGKVPTGRHYGAITYAGDRPSSWASHEDIWVHGYWTWDWAESTQRIEQLDTERRRITLAEPHHRYGYTSGQRYYYFNIPEELDRPGEWYLDREAGLLYFWPPEEDFSGEVILSGLESPFIRVDGAAHLSFEGFAMAYSRGPGMVITDSDSIVVRHFRFYGLGGRPVTVEGGHACGVRDSSFTELSAGAVFLSGGDRATLARGNHFAVNNHIHAFSRDFRTSHPAIRLHGVGQRAAHNHIHDAPHVALYFRGNDHLIEFNEIHDIAQETGDVGAIYTGRDYTSRGTVIRYNYLHNLHGPGLHGVRGVYLDDFTSGIDVFGNVFYRAGRAAFIGGGRDNRIQNNLFIECQPSIQIDGRGLSWAVHHFDVDHPRYASTLRDAYEEAKVNEPPYANRYPELIGLYEGDPRIPSGNIVENNLSFGGIFLDLYDGIDLEMATVRQNLIGDPVALRMSETSDQNPEFETFRLDDPSTGEILTGNTLWKFGTRPYRIDGGQIRFHEELLPGTTGFLPLPMERIGLKKER
ncbi:MAG: right-handed parallel beta-helix repeat-containing protein [Oceanipulchritudo sp.]